MQSIHRGEKNYLCRNPRNFAKVLPSLLLNAHNAHQRQGESNGG